MKEQTGLEVALVIPDILQQFEIKDIIESEAVFHLHYHGGHAITNERFETIVDWIAEQSRLQMMTEKHQNNFYVLTGAIIR